MRKLVCFLIVCLSLVRPETGFAITEDLITFLFFPPENLSRQSSIAWVGEALILSISDQIERPGVEILPRGARLSYVEDADLPSGSPLSRASMIRVAQLADADELILGMYSGNEGSLRVTLQILDMKTMKLGTEIVATGPVLSLAEMENELAWQILAQRGLQTDSSREVFRNKTRKIPNAAYALLALGLGVTEEEGRVKFLQQAVDKHADFTEALGHLGRYYFKKGDCARAVQRLEGALSLDKFYRETQLMLGTCYCKLGNNAKVIRAYSALLPFDPPMEVLNNLGVAYLREGDLPLAVDSLKRARRLEETNAVVTLNLAILRYLQGEHNTALALLDEVLRSNAGHGLGHYLRSRVLQAQGDSVKSDEALAQAIRLGIDPEKLRHDDPRHWTQFFMSSAHLP